MKLYQKFVKLIRGSDTNAQFVEESSTSVSVTNQQDHRRITTFYTEAEMNELTILRAAMQDIAASGSEKANISLVLAEQIRNETKIETPATVIPRVKKSAAQEITELVQHANDMLSSAIAANGSSWNKTTDYRIEDARKSVNKIASVLLKDAE